MSEKNEIMKVKSSMRPNKHRLILSIIAFLGYSAVTLARGHWPEFYRIGAPGGASIIDRVGSLVTYLDDDVMISLRAGSELLISGRPAFNTIDVAQPSTSYLSPYIFAPLRAIFGNNLSVAVFAIIGFFAVGLTMALIIYFSRSLLNAILLVLFLTFTTTNLIFSLNGWDHIFQGLFLSGSLIVAFKTTNSRPGLLVQSFLLVLAVVARPDGIFLAVAIFGITLYRNRDLKLTLIFGIIPFAALGGLIAVLNQIQFGHFTPTTARLKIGASPSNSFAWNYFVENTLLSFSVLSVIAILVIWLMLLSETRTFDSYFLLTGALLTVVIALVNSDFFEGARMAWSPAVMLATLISLKSPSLLVFGQSYQQLMDTWTVGIKGFASSVVALTILSALCLVTFAAGFSGSLARSGNDVESKYYQNFKLASWLEANLDPELGPVGLFFAGMSYYLPSFEVADFLGKGDELIAGTPAKWGPPGHNKWNVDLTLSKWNPQIIVPALELDPSDPKVVSDLQNWIDIKADHGYVPEFALSESVNADFAWCAAMDLRNGGSVEMSTVLVRRDLLSDYGDLFLCDS